jgi:hypothetical protein
MVKRSSSTIITGIVLSNVSNDQFAHYFWQHNEVEYSHSYYSKMFNPEERLFFTSSVWQVSRIHTAVLIHQVGQACNF